MLFLMWLLNSIIAEVKPLEEIKYLQISTTILKHSIHYAAKIAAHQLVKVLVRFRFKLPRYKDPELSLQTKLARLFPRSYQFSLLALARPKCR